MRRSYRPSENSGLKDDKSTKVKFFVAEEAGDLGLDNLFAPKEAGVDGEEAVFVPELVDGTGETFLFLPIG